MGITGKGGKPKGQRKYSDCDWKPKEDTSLKTMIDQGYDYDTIADQLGRSRLGVVLHARRLQCRMMHSTAQLTARDVQRLLGIGDAKTVAAWIEKFGWLEARSGGPHTIYRMSWPALLAMLKAPQTWMAWTPEQIADQALRDWATELRKDKGYWISTVTIYGMLDAKLYDNVATASLQAVNLGATVVSRSDAPHVTATFSRMVDACAFMTWLSQSDVVYHTAQLTQTSELLATPWPFQDAERVKASCIQLTRDYNIHAKQYRTHSVHQDAADLIAKAIARTPLLSLTQEGYHP